MAATCCVAACVDNAVVEISYPYACNRAGVMTFLGESCIVLHK